MEWVWKEGKDFGGTERLQEPDEGVGHQIVFLKNVRSYAHKDSAT